jgi:hypothetical protein
MMIHDRTAHEERRSGRCIEFPSPTGIVLDPHVVGSCVIIFGETAARAVYEVFHEWLS